MKSDKENYLCDLLYCVREMAIEARRACSENGVGDSDMRARELALVEVLLFAKAKAAAFDMDERELGLAYDPLSEELFDIPVSRDL